MEEETSEAKENQGSEKTTEISKDEKVISENKGTFEDVTLKSEEHISCPDSELEKESSEIDLSSPETSTAEERRQSAHELKKLFVKKLSSSDLTLRAFGVPKKT